MKKILKPVFSKKILGLLILILQILFIVTTIDKLYSFRIIVYGGTTVIAAVVILWEINRDVSPSFKIIWIALVAVMPFFGVLLYLYVHLDILNFDRKKQLGIISNETKKHIEKITEGINQISKAEPDEYGIFNYLHKHANAPCFYKSDISFLKIGEEMYASLIKDVQEAKQYVFIEFFIINESSYMWNNLKNILVEKANQGVDVRIIYDGMGSLSCTSNDFVEKLNAHGVKCRIFSPVKPFISSYHNNRDHRKIVVIDGKCAYTGGINIADEYINKKSRFGHWKDSAVRLTGDAVEGFAFLFLKMWNLLTNDKVEYSHYIANLDSDSDTKGFLAPFDDNPLDNESVTKNVYLHMIDNAKKYIFISTPYLILDDDLSDSLKFAAKRGVDVKITMPHIPDKWYAFALARTYYPELIKAGVKIYEYTPGFVHAKSTVSDDVRAFVGSANYDFRSLYLHYECGVYIYKKTVINDMVADYNDTLKKCHLFTLEDYKELKLIYRLVGRIFRFFAPLM